MKSSRCIVNSRCTAFYPTGDHDHDHDEPTYERHLSPRPRVMRYSLLQRAPNFFFNSLNYARRATPSVSLTARLGKLGRASSLLLLFRFTFRGKWQHDSVAIGRGRGALSK